MDNSILLLITRHLSNEATLKEVEALQNWLAEDYNNQMEYLQFKMAWNSERVNYHAYDLERGLQLLRTKMTSLELKEISLVLEESVSKKKKFGSAIYTTLAVVLLFLSFIVYWKLFTKEAAEPAYIVEINPRGQQSEVQLPDGSKVWLNAQSELKYLADFDGKERKVYLKGEAFFEVVKDKSRPFIVESGVRTKVLGTSFNVKAYPQDSDIQVAVVSGKVSILEPRENKVITLLAPKERMIYTKSDKGFSKDTLDTKLLSLWKEGVINIDNKCFAEISRELERWYGVEIIFKNEDIKSCEFAGSFQGLPLSKVLDLICQTGNFTYRMDNKTVWIDGKKCHK